MAVIENTLQIEANFTKSTTPYIKYSHLKIILFKFTCTSSSCRALVPKRNLSLCKEKTNAFVSHQYLPNGHVHRPLKPADQRLQCISALGLWLLKSKQSVGKKRTSEPPESCFNKIFFKIRPSYIPLPSLHLISALLITMTT